MAAREPAGVQRARNVHLNVLLLANRSLESLEEICKRAGITHPQYIALWVLCLADDVEAGLPMGSLADGLLNRAADTTRLVDRMVKAGLVERLPNPADRRGVLVRATAAGQAAFASATPELQAFHGGQWAELESAEVDELDRLLQKALWGDARSR